MKSWILPAMMMAASPAMASVAMPTVATRLRFIGSGSVFNWKGFGAHAPDRLFVLRYDVRFIKSR